MKRCKISLGKVRVIEWHKYLIRFGFARYSIPAFYGYYGCSTGAVSGRGAKVGGHCV